MSRVLSAAVAAGTALTNSAAEGTLASYSFPANFFQNGSIVDFRCVIKSTSTTSTTTLTLAGKFGGTTVYTGGAVDEANGDVSVITGRIVVRDADASGTAVVTMLGSDPDANGSIAPKAAASVISSLDFTAALTLVITGTWSAADANTCQCEAFEIVQVQ